MHWPHLDPNLPHLADVVPAVLAAMGVETAAADRRVPLGLPDRVAGACVLLIDGLGADLLERYAHHAPVLAGLQSRTLTVGFPSTTAAGLAAVGTGCRSGEHGMVGYSFRLPGAGLLNSLRWRPQPWGEDLRDRYPPEQIQPRATTFERAAATGMAVTVVSGAEFDGSGLTRAVLRGGRYVGVHGIDDLADQVRTAIAGGGFSYGYHGELDMMGHLHGPGSTVWRRQLEQVDRLVESIVAALPPSGLLVVVADHGMVEVDGSDGVVDADDLPQLQTGVVAIGGEPRARHVYAADGAAGDVLAAWRETLADRAWVLAREEAIDAGWFGSRVTDQVLPRIGDVVAAARGTAAVVRRQVEPMESALLGHHGSLTRAEHLVPLIVAVG